MLHENLPAKRKPIEKPCLVNHRVKVHIRSQDSKSELLKFFLKLLTDVEFLILEGMLFHILTPL